VNRKQIKAKSSPKQLKVEGKDKLERIRNNHKVRQRESRKEKESRNREYDLVIKEAANKNKPTEEKP